MNERGYSLVEVLVAVGLVALAAVSIMPAFMTMVGTNARNGVRSAAVTAAEVELEGLRLLDPELMATSGSSSPTLVTVGDAAYEVITHYCEDATLCWDTSRHVRVEVRQNGNMVYDVETVFTQIR